MASSPSTTYFKCLLVGDIRAGKTAFVAHHLGQPIPAEYNATLGVNVNPITFKTTTGNFICFTVWDCAGDARFAGLGEGYYVDAQCAIIAYDASDLSARHPNLAEWRAKLGAIPIVIIGTHRDLLHPDCAIKCARETILVDSITSDRASKLHCHEPFAELAHELAQVVLIPNMDVSASAPAKLMINIDALMPTYTFAPFITTALVELRRVSERLLDLSKMRKMGGKCSASMACTPELIVSEFASTYGINVDGTCDVSDGYYSIVTILHIIARATDPIPPTVTQEFIDTIDRALFEFIVARITLINGVFRSAEPIYCKAIEDIAAKMRVTMK